MYLFVTTYFVAVNVTLIVLVSVQVYPHPVDPVSASASTTNRDPVLTSNSDTKIVRRTRSIVTEAPLRDSLYYGLYLLATFDRIEKEVEVALRRGDQEELRQVKQKLERLGTQSKEFGKHGHDHDPGRALRYWYDERIRHKIEKYVRPEVPGTRDDVKDKERTYERVGSQDRSVFAFICMVFFCIALTIRCKSIIFGTNSGRPLEERLLETVLPRVCTGVPGSSGSDSSPTASPFPSPPPSPSPNEINRTEVNPSDFAPVLVQKEMGAPPAYDEAIRSSRKPLLSQSSEDEPPPFSPDFDRRSLR